MKVKDLVITCVCLYYTGYVNERIIFIYVVFLPDVGFMDI